MYVRLHLQKKVLLAMYLYVQYLNHKSGVSVPLFYYLSLVATHLSNIVVWVREFEYLATKTTNYE